MLINEEEARISHLTKIQARKNTSTTELAPPSHEIINVKVHGASEARAARDLLTSGVLEAASNENLEELKLIFSESDHQESYDEILSLLAKHPPPRLNLLRSPPRI